MIGQIPYHKGDIVKVHTELDVVEIWEVHAMTPNILDEHETDPDIRFFVEELPKVMNGGFTSLQYHLEEDQWEAVITIPTRRIREKIAQVIEGILIKRYGENWKLWTKLNRGVLDVHILYWT